MVLEMWKENYKKVKIYLNIFITTRKIFAYPIYIFIIFYEKKNDTFKYFKISLSLSLSTQFFYVRVHNIYIHIDIYIIQHVSLIYYKPVE